MKFEKEQQFNNIQDTARAKQIKLVDESINALKLSPLLAQLKYNLKLIINVKNNRIDVFLLFLLYINFEDMKNCIKKNRYIKYSQSWLI